MAAKKCRPIGPPYRLLKPLTRVSWVKPFKPREINDVSTHVVRAIGVSFGPHRLSNNFRVCTTGKKETRRIARYRRYFNSEDLNQDSIATEFV